MSIHGHAYKATTCQGCTTSSMLRSQRDSLSIAQFEYTLPENDNDAAIVVFHQEAPDYVIAWRQCLLFCNLVVGAAFAQNDLPNGADWPSCKHGPIATDTFLGSSAKPVSRTHFKMSAMLTNDNSLILQQARNLVLSVRLNGHCHNVSSAPSVLSAFNIGSDLTTKTCSRSAVDHSVVLYPLSFIPIAKMKDGPLCSIPGRMWCCVMFFPPPSPSPPIPFFLCFGMRKRGVSE